MVRGQEVKGTTSVTGAPRVAKVWIATSRWGAHSPEASARATLRVVVSSTPSMSGDATEPDRSTSTRADATSEGATRRAITAASAEGRGWPSSRTPRRRGSSLSRGCPSQP